MGIQMVSRKSAPPFSPLADTDLSTQPILAAQSSLTGPDIPVSIAILIFSQNIVAAVWLAIASTIFSNSLQRLIPQYAPTVDAAAIINAGATGIRNVVQEGPLLTQVLDAYSKSIDNTFYIATASLGAGIFFVWGMGWKDIRHNKQANDVPLVPI